jgi:hypothetical protein
MLLSWSVEEVEKKRSTLTEKHRIFGSLHANLTSNLSSCIHVRFPSKMSVQHRMLKNKTQIPNKVNNPIHKNGFPNLVGVCVYVYECVLVWVTGQAKKEGYFLKGPI